MPRYVCIHGHFYQPPRESPWLEAIELQDDAYPFHDWNERILAECYENNGRSRILDEKGRIVEITNNYGHISFNFGPTLMSWLEQHAPLTYERIIDADRRSADRFSGHGSAIAQVYNHMIMPLANRRDKVTQVRWGIADFRKRFGRDPVGMWLPETAVDLETLDVLAEHEIRFTILAPKQAARFRRMGEDRWHDVGGETIDTSRCYRQHLPSGRSIAIFFYHGPISHDVAFNRLLHSGQRYYERIRDEFGRLGSDDESQARLISIATDGESYGHHHRHGDMALAAVIRRLEDDPDITITNYAEFLAKHPPEYEVEIAEQTSWSCAHGIERWRSDCGCHSGRHPQWKQTWRKPLREALDWLRDTLAPKFEERAGEVFHDPWAARDGYGGLVLDRSRENADAFLAEYAREAAHAGENRVAALRLMELQRHLMLMYTSCGWFFDDIAGIETVQVLQYAGRAVQLAEQLFGDHVEEEFLSRLEHARGNRPDVPDGRAVFEQRVLPARTDLETVAAHYAMSSLFEDYSSHPQIFCYAIDSRKYQQYSSGRAHLVIGRAHIASTITGEDAELTFGVLHLVDHNLHCFVRRFRDDSAYEEMASEVEGAFTSGHTDETLRRLDQHFEEHRYTLQSLFHDEQRKILSIILSATLKKIENTYRKVYEDSVALLRGLGGVDVPVPAVLRTTVEFIINADLRRAFEAGEVDLDQVQTTLNKTKEWGLHLDTEGLAFALQHSLERTAEKVQDQPDDLDAIARLDRLAQLGRMLPFEIDLWQSQNVLYDLLESGRLTTDDNSDSSRLVASLAEKLKVKR